jgi:hypothetical protein
LKTDGIVAAKKGSPVRRNVGATPATDITWSGGLDYGGSSEQQSGGRNERLVVEQQLAEWRVERFVRQLAVRWNERVEWIELQRLEWLERLQWFGIERQRLRRIGQ